MREGQASRTAMMVALWRTMADRGVTSVPGFSDPAARAMLTGSFWERALRWLEPVMADPGSEKAGKFRPWVDMLTLRVAFIDALLNDAAAPQVVILGAGMDTRVWRLPVLQGARVFEVDHPATQAHKLARAAEAGPPLVTPTYVTVDFGRDDLADRLKAAGFDPTVRTAWVWEGVIMYLDDAALRTTLRAVRALSAPGSTLIAHYHEPDPTGTGWTVRTVLLGWFGEPQIGMRPAAEMEAEVREAGFTLVQDANLEAQAARVGGVPSTDPRARCSRILLARAT